MVHVHVLILLRPQCLAERLISLLLAGSKNRDGRSLSVRVGQLLLVFVQDERQGEALEVVQLLFCKYAGE